MVEEVEMGPGIIHCHDSEAETFLGLYNYSSKGDRISSTCQQSQSKRHDFNSKRSRTRSGKSSQTACL